MDASILGFLRDHVLFKEYSNNTSFLDTLMSMITTRVCTDGTYVIRKGEVGRAMFFILRGEIQVISEDGETIINTLAEQSFFGEIGLLFSVPRTVSCRAHGRAILLTITKESLEKAVAPYPRIAHSISQIAEERYSSHIKQVESSVSVDFSDELRIGVTQQDLKLIPLFRDCEIGFLHNLALTLRPVKYSTDKLIIQKGEMASEMFFVVRGVAEVFNEHTGQVFAQFQPGSFFGEVGLFFKIKRSASVRCNTKEVMVFKLLKKDLDHLLVDYPEVRMKVEAEASQRLLYIESRAKANLDKTVQDITDVEVVRERLKTIPLFHGSSTSFLHQLVLATKIRVVGKNEIIIRKGEIGNSMYFVISGAVQVISESDSKVLVTMESNTFFGEVALFYRVNRTATVRASHPTTLIEISNDVVQNILKFYPDLMQVIHQRAKENFEAFTLRQRALLHCDFSAIDQQRFDIEATISRLRKVPIFEKCDEGFLGTLALNTSIRTLKMSEFVIKTGDPSLEMYFLAHGRVQIVSADGNTVYDSVEEGGFFGEVGVVRGVNRTASVRVDSPVCGLLVLSADAMRKALNKYPENFQLVVLAADKRYHLAEQRVLNVEYTLTSKRNTDTMSSESTLNTWSMASGLNSTTPTQKSTEKRKNSNGSISNIMAPFGQIFSRRTRPKSLTIGNKSSNLKLTTSVVSQDLTVDPLAIYTISKWNSGWSALREIPRGPIELKYKESTHVKHALGKMFNTLKIKLNSSDEAKNRISPTSAKLIQDKGSKLLTESPNTKTQQRLLIAQPKFLKHILDANETQLQTIFSHIMPVELLKLRGVCRVWSKMLLLKVFWNSLDLKSKFRLIDRKAVDAFSYLGGNSIAHIDLTGCWMIQDSDLCILISRCSGIRNLIISNCWKVTDQGIAYIAKGCRELQHLDISHCGQISGKGLPIIQLYRLDLRDSDHISDKCLKWIASSCVDLSDLNLTFCTRITNSGMYDLSLGSQKFHRLQFTACAQLTDASVIYFSDSIRQLTYISLRQCRKMTDGVAIYLAATSPKLMCVDMTSCPFVTDGIVAQVHTKNAQVVVRVDQSAVSRGVVWPGTCGKPKAEQVALRDVFTSGPKGMMGSSRKSRRTNDRIRLVSIKNKGELPPMAGRTGDNLLKARKQVVPAK
ncbi:hypothetical protein BASA50_004016 [Batrachochytrium salamandrivorans]|uniref:Cyclic nucleotide-binding domain-containing protein n=1 Tax=Batrachochytrium salamandrivorans TaxID=1357716 RepID=A0ABQ8FHF9_9FUNG|nr:hypothetical protein BASA50_004016 [Batrachochytrium salamandrivorans]